MENFIRKLVEYQFPRNCKQFKRDRIQELEYAHITKNVHAKNVVRRWFPPDMNPRCTSAIFLKLIFDENQEILEIRNMALDRALWPNANSPVFYQDDEFFMTNLIEQNILRNLIYRVVVFVSKYHFVLELNDKEVFKWMHKGNERYSTKMAMEFVKMAIKKKIMVIGMGFLRESFIGEQECSWEFMKTSVHDMVREIVDPVIAEDWKEEIAKEGYHVYDYSNRKSEEKQYDERNYFAVHFQIVTMNRYTEKGEICYTKFLEHLK